MTAASIHAIFWIIRWRTLKERVQNSVKQKIVLILQKLFGQFYPVSNKLSVGDVKV